MRSHLVDLLIEDGEQLLGLLQLNCFLLDLALLETDLHAELLKLFFLLGIY